MPIGSWGDGLVGIADEGAGQVAFQSLRASIRGTVKFFQNALGNDTGASVWNEASEITGDGMLTTTHTTGEAIGAVWGLVANNLLILTDSSDGSPEVFVSGIDITLHSQDYQEGSVRGFHRPGIASA